MTDLANGRNELAGDDVFLMFQTNQTVATLDVLYEYHRRYADIHVVLSGQEMISYGQGASSEHTAYDGSSDFALVTCEARQELVMKPGYFALFWPGEPHCPNLAVMDTEKITKMVIKVAIS